MRKYRLASQGLFLLLFLFLFIQTESKGLDTLGYPVRVFLDFDPLLFLSALLSSHAVPAALLLSLILVLITVVLGRVFCGWVCPLGTIHNMAGVLNSRKRKRPLGWFGFKYYLLIFLVASSLFTLQLAGIFDPLSLLIRSLSLGIYPAYNFIMRSAFDSIYGVPVIGGISEIVYSVVKKGFISFQQPFFFQSLFISSIFILVLGLNFREKRFWCRYLCPLGAMLGLLSRHSLLKRSVSEGCNECGVCTSACQSGASRSGADWRKEECLYCTNCDDLCPKNAVRFGIGKNPLKATVGMDLQRRHLITASIAGIIAVPFFRIGPLSRPEFVEAGLIRPPGSLAEKEFLKTCIRCGECMKVCITNGLQPTLFEAGAEGIWTPHLIPRVGFCEFNCTLCGQVCPTGAIRKLQLEQKTKTKIGLAMIDKGRCLPYAHGKPCIVCEEVCPTPKKAIWLETVRERDRSGKVITLKQPHVDLDLCIGCGICETKCPVLGRPAVYVMSLGESRSKENQLLL